MCLVCNVFLNVRRSGDVLLVCVLGKEKNERISSNPVFNVATNQLQETSFTPCNYHPQFLVDGKQRILNGSFLAHHPSEKSSSVQIGGYTAGPSSRQSVPYINDQVSFPSQVHEKTGKSHAPVQLVGRKLQHSVSPSGLLRITRNSGPGNDVSSSRVPPQQADNAPTSLDVEEGSFPAVIQCPYTRTAEDQNNLKRSSSRENSGAVPLDGRKRQQRKQKPGRLSLQCRAP